MNHGVSAELVAIGDEVLGGYTVDTNSAWMARQLARIGVRVVRHTAVGDDMEDLLEVFDAACRRADVVVACGGLGPTPDDMTRFAVARFVDRPLVEQPEAVEHMKEIFRQFNRAMAPTNLRQARFPEGARLLENPLGTAMGFAVETRGTRMYFVPGIPNELMGMAPQILDDIAEHLPGVQKLHELSFRTVGIGESDLAQALEGLLERGGDPMVGTYVTSGIITVRLFGTDADATTQLWEQMIERLRENVYTRDERSLEEVLVGTLAERGQTLAVAESCTGGLVSKEITDVSGSSAVLLEGAVVYSNDAKVRRCGVPPEMLRQHGAVSEPVARQLAEGIREASGATWGIGITGIAGPTGGTDEKPVGLVYIALSGPTGTEVEKNNFRGPRFRVRRRTATRALDMLRRAMG